MASLWIALALFVVLFGCAVLRLRAGSKGAPAAHTGGFGEQTCALCHGRRWPTPGEETNIQAPSEYLLGKRYNVQSSTSAFSGRNFGFHYAILT